MSVLVASFQPEETQTAEREESAMAPDNGGDERRHEAAEPCPRLGSISRSVDLCCGPEDGEATPAEGAASRWRQTVK